MTQLSVSQETSTKLELVWGQRVWGAGGRDIKHGQGVISPGEIQTFQKDEGVCVYVCVCVCVCVVMAYFLLSPSSYSFSISSFFFIFIAPIAKCLICLIILIQIGVLIFILMPSFTYNLNALFLRVCGPYLFAFRMWTKIEAGIACLQDLNFGWGKRIVSKCQVCHRCGCVLRRQIVLSKYLEHFTQLKFLYCSLYLYASG